MRKFIYSLLLAAFALCISPKDCFTQNIELDYSGQPLNEILIDFNSRFGVEVSIDAGLSGACIISIKKTFSSVDEAVRALAERCGLEVVRINDVYTFRILRDEAAAVKKQAERFLFQGEVVEANTGEALPFTSIAMEDLSLVADADGRFSFKSTDQHRQIQFSHLGYSQIDTVVGHGNQLKIALVPGSFNIDEVVISASSISPLAASGEEAGHIKLNDVSTRLIPGDNSNMIFNHLRLYPGITAAGESLSDYIIWGSYAGHNQVIFDGITLFNSYGSYDDIGRVNPLLIKNIEVYKGGYNVDVGDRIGGVVLIDGRSGNREEVDGKISVSSELANAWLSIPMFRKSSTLQLAGRKSYYQWLNWNDIIDDEEENFITPEYDYGDANIKFETSFSNNDKLEISALISRDTYVETLQREGPARYMRELDVTSIQVGSSLQYLRMWKKGGLSTLRFSQSSYKSELNSHISFRRSLNPDQDVDYQDNWINPIREYSVQASHRFAAVRGQDIEVSLAYVRDQYEFRSTSSFSLSDLNEHADRLSIYVKDDISATRWLSFTVGLKVDVPFSDFKPFFQPRVNGRIDLAERWKMSFGWGMYNQFVSKTPVTDMEGNRLVIWQTADGQTIPVLNSMHHALGLSYLSKHLEVVAEGYYRSTGGISRFFENRDDGTGFFGEGEARAYGMDVYAKTRFREHELWASYSLARAEEKGVNATEYREASQSQRHEIKTALVLNFKPVSISITNVYGTGFPSPPIQTDENDYTPYNRLDLAFQYGVDIKKTRLETGFSILNILNRDNVRLNQFARFPDGTTATTSAIPFTPSVYLNFGW